MMQVLITENDYVQTLGREQARKLTEAQREAVLGNGDAGNRHAILDAFPKVIVERIKKMIPEDFDLLEIEMKMQIAGQPFGIGISGDATVKFGPRSHGV